MLTIECMRNDGEQKTWKGFVSYDGSKEGGYLFQFREVRRSEAAVAQERKRRTKRFENEELAGATNAGDLATTLRSDG